MSKIVVTADFHLNLNNRIEDYKKSLQQISDIANQNELLLILGDVYHARRPIPREQNIFRDFLNTLKVPTIIVVGNHDTDIDATTLDEFRKFNIANVTLQFAPYILEYKGLKLYLDHRLIEGAKLGPTDVILNTREVVKIEDLLKKVQADFYLFGHIHKSQVVRKNPPMLYTGSIERVDFAERNENKYVVLIDVESKVYGYRKLNVRPMQQIDIDLSVSSDIPKVLEEGSIVKVVVKGTKEQIQKFNEAPLRDSLVTSLTYKIIHEVVKENKTRNNQISETKTVLDSFNEYSKTKEFDEETTQTGVKLMNEVDSK
jgi:DNA repair exonuclease SbcCD nuclease subunit